MLSIVLLCEKRSEVGWSFQQREDPKFLWFPAPESSIWGVFSPPCSAMQCLNRVETSKPFEDHTESPKKELSEKMFVRKHARNIWLLEVPGCFRLPTNGNLLRPWRQPADRTLDFQQMSKQIPPKQLDQLIKIHRGLDGDTWNVSLIQKLFNYSIMLYAGGMCCRSLSKSTPDFCWLLYADVVWLWDKPPRMWVFRAINIDTIWLFNIAIENDHL